MIIDFHSHAFPEAIAARALAALGKCSGGLLPWTDGTVQGVAAQAARCGIDKSVILNIATNAGQQAAVNDYAASINQAQAQEDSGIAAFGSIHPFAPDAADELRRIKALGLKGVKLHPDYQMFFADDERMFPLYALAAELGLITVFHAGVDIGLFEPVYGSPERIARALPAFNGGVVVAAHFGGYMQWDAVEEALVGKDVYFDTSYCAGRMPILQARRIVKNHGADRVLFGTDLPWGDPMAELRFARAFELSEEDEAKVLGGNAARLLGLI